LALVVFCADLNQTPSYGVGVQLPSFSWFHWRLASRRLRPSSSLILQALAFLSLSVCVLYLRESVRLICVCHEVYTVRLVLFRLLPVLGLPCRRTTSLNAKEQRRRLLNKVAVDNYSTPSSLPRIFPPHCLFRVGYTRWHRRVLWPAAGS